LNFTGLLGFVHQKTTLHEHGCEIHLTSYRVVTVWEGCIAFLVVIDMNLPNPSGCTRSWGSLSL
jgi:hypothetical protein